jgi:hypothetical protein
MGLMEVQRVLARLYTEDELRERFFADPAAVGKTLGLDIEETRRVAELSAGEVRGFARSLRRKRLGEVAKLLPMTRRALGALFDRLFFRYAGTADRSVPRGIRKHREDAAAFASFLAAEASAGGVPPAWAADLARYEAAGLKASEPGRTCLVCWYRYPVARLAGSSPAPGPTVGLWVRLFPLGRLWHVTLSLPWLRRR